MNEKKEKIEVLITAEQRSFLQDLVTGSSANSTVGEAAAWLIGLVLEGVKQARSIRGGTVKPPPPPTAKGEKTLASTVKPWDLWPAPTAKGREVTDLIGLSDYTSK